MLDVVLALFVLLQEAEGLEQSLIADAHGGEAVGRQVLGFARQVVVQEVDLLLAGQLAVGHHQVDC